MISRYILTAEVSDGNPVSQFIDGVAGAVAFLVESFYTTLFNISPLYTEGVWPFGRPVAPEIVGPEHTFKGGFVAYVAEIAYDKVSPVEGGEILIFSLTLFAILYIVGGYVQFFDWKIDNPKRKRDPVVGMMFMLLWFPIYYGFLSSVHALMLLIPVDRTEVAFAITTIASSAIVTPGPGWMALIIGAIGFAVIVLIMFLRPFVIGVYLLFGQPLIGVVWGDIPRASGIAMTVLKGAIPTAIVPLPLYLMMYAYSFVVSGESILGYEFGGWGITSATLVGVGVYGFAIATWLTVWLMWIVFTRTGKIVDRAGESLGRVGGTLGFLGTGRTEDAARAAKYGPTSVVAREGVEESGRRAGEAKESGKQYVSQVVGSVTRNVWGDDDGSRDQR